MTLLFASADGLFQVAVEKGRQSPTSGGVAVFHRETGQPMLSVGDTDGDGIFDVLEYSVLDEYGEGLLTVIDYEADGQPDLRMNFAEEYNEIWHSNRWYRVEKREGQQGIVVDGEFLELTIERNRPVLR
jgi:hypothetical protein